MSYNHYREEIYGRSIFTIENNGQEVLMVFEPTSAVENCYSIIIYASDGSKLIGYHEKKFWITLYCVLSKFDNNRRLQYEIIAV